MQLRRSKRVAEQAPATVLLPGNQASSEEDDIANTLVTNCRNKAKAKKLRRKNPPKTTVCRRVTIKPLKAKEPQPRNNKPYKPIKMETASGALASRPCPASVAPDPPTMPLSKLIHNDMMARHIKLPVMASSGKRRLSQEASDQALARWVASLVSSGSTQAGPPASRREDEVTHQLSALHQVPESDSDLEPLDETLAEAVGLESCSYSPFKPNHSLRTIHSSPFPVLAHTSDGSVQTSLLPLQLSPPLPVAQAGILTDVLKSAASQEEAAANSTPGVMTPEAQEGEVPADGEAHPLCQIHIPRFWASDAKLKQLDEGILGPHSASPEFYNPCTWTTMSAGLRMSGVSSSSVPMTAGYRSEPCHLPGRTYSFGEGSLASITSQPSQVIAYLLPNYAVFTYR